MLASLISQPLGGTDTDTECWQRLHDRPGSEFKSSLVLEASVDGRWNRGNSDVF